MARVHGKDVNWAYNGVNLESELNTVTINIESSEADITSFAAVGQNSLSGKVNVTTEIAGSLNMSAGAGDATLFAGLGTGVKTTIFDPTGSGPGSDNPEYTCTASGLTGVLIRSYEIALPVGAAATYTAELQQSGSTTRATS